MDRSELLDDRDFISGIYNYCDRWCERCPFTSRCRLYAMERSDADFDDPDTRDINNAKFWRKLESIFKETHQMILDWAEEAGVDLSAVDAEEAIATEQRHEADAKQHQLSISARRYADMVQQWFTEEFAVEENVHDDTNGNSERNEDDIDRNDALEVVRWYQFFIAVKLFRALMGAKEAVPDEELPDTGIDAIFAQTEDETEDGEGAEDAEMLEALYGAAADDSEGSAKIALIAIERSVNAWRVLQNSLPEKADTIIPLLLELERLRRTAEQTFPTARDFVRPGFDEVLSDFVS